MREAPRHAPSDRSQLMPGTPRTDRRADIKDVMDVLDNTVFNYRLTGVRDAAASNRRWQRRQA